MSNSLTGMRPELVREWSDKNLPLTPEKMYGGNALSVIRGRQRFMSEP